MSYVIQNFSEFKRISLTPRLKFLFFVMNLDKLLMFLKFNIFFKFLNKFNSFQLIYSSSFITHFFSEQYFKVIYNFNFKLIGLYDNNLIKSCLYYFFNNVLKHISNVNFKWKNFIFKDKILFNSYLVPLKLANIRINNRLAKNIFFYNILIFPFIWYQHTSNLKFYLNFILPNQNLKLLKFYNGYFFKIYNF